MQRPEVRIIEPQINSAPQEINLPASEVAALMAKYGYANTQPNNFVPPIIQKPIDPNANLTFDEMIAMEEMKNRQENQRKEAERLRELNKPTPYSFDRNRVQHYDNQYKSLDDTGFGIEVKVVSDMPINKGYGY